MKAENLKLNQRSLKERYAADPNSALDRLFSRGSVDFENLSFKLELPVSLNPAGLHMKSGGDGTFVCPVEIMLAGWASCAGVTFAAVAHSMRLSIDSCQIEASGEIDFKGTLAVGNESPVGLTRMSIRFDLISNELPESIEKLIALTEKYCVVQHTLKSPPELHVDVQHSTTEH